MQSIESYLQENDKNYKIAMIKKQINIMKQSGNISLSNTAQHKYIQLKNKLSKLQESDIPSVEESSKLKDYGGPLAYGVGVGVAVPVLYVMLRKVISKMKKAKDPKERAKYSKMISKIQAKIKAKKK